MKSEANFEYRSEAYASTLNEERKIGKEFAFYQGSSLLPALPARASLFDIHVRKSVVEYRRFNQFLEYREICITPLLRKLASRRAGEQHRVEWWSGISPFGSERLGTNRSRRRSLSGRQGIVFVIKYEIRDWGISPAGVQKMPKSYTIAVAVTPDADDREFGVREFYARGKWQSPAMERLRSIPVEILRYFSATADTAHEYEVAFGNSQFLDRLADGSEDDEIPAARAPLDCV